MQRRTVLIALLVLALSVAGCQTPGAAGVGEPTTIEVRNATGATVGTTIPVSNGSSIDPGVVYDDLLTILGSDADPPQYVRVVDAIDDIGANLSQNRPRVWRLLEVVPREPNRSLRGMENGVTSILGHVTIYPGENRTERSTRWVVAHELVHYVHLDEGRWQQVANATGRDTTDAQFAYRATVEGAAVYTTDAYIERFASHLPLTEPFYDDLIAAFPPGSRARYSLRMYAFGTDHVGARIDDPRNLSVVFEHPPRTSEQVIHPGAAGPVALSITAPSTDAWSATGHDRMGEAFVWSALADEIGVDRARAAAAGWGNDSLRVYHPDGGGNASYAWVIRFDDAANASEFGSVARDYLDADGTQDGDVWRISGGYAALQEVDDRTYALLLGDRAFVAGTNVTSGDGVVITPPSG